MCMCVCVCLCLSLCVKAPHRYSPQHGQSCLVRLIKGGVPERQELVSYSDGVTDQCRLVTVVQPRFTTSGVNVGMSTEERLEYGGL